MMIWFRSPAEPVIKLLYNVVLLDSRRNRARGKEREKRKVWSPLFFILSFPPYSSLGHDLPVNSMRKPHRASQIKIFCSRHPFTLQRDAKGSAWPIPLDLNKVYSRQTFARSRKQEGKRPAVKGIKNTDSLKTAKRFIWTQKNKKKTFWRKTIELVSSLPFSS
jgi:hypothetical protein